MLTLCKLPARTGADGEHFREEFLQSASSLPQQFSCPSAVLFGYSVQCVCSIQLNT